MGTDTDWHSKHPVDLIGFDRTTILLHLLIMLDYVRLQNEVKAFSPDSDSYGVLQITKNELAVRSLLTGCWCWCRCWMQVPVRASPLIYIFDIFAA